MATKSNARKPAKKNTRVRAKASVRIPKRTGDSKDGSYLNVKKKTARGKSGGDAAGALSGKGATRRYKQTVKSASKDNAKDKTGRAVSSLSFADQKKVAKGKYRKGVRKGAGYTVARGAKKAKKK